MAETEHLPTASEALGVSPSALSRALKQLEAAVGVALFVRDGRHIRLNESGNELLSAVRLGMRGIDDALSVLANDETPLPLRVAAPGPFFGALILDVLAEVSAAHPRVRVELSSCPSDSVIASLRRGHVDVCVHEEELEADDLESQHLADIASVVACARTHPLANAAVLEAGDLTEHVFAAPPMNPLGRRPDNWPSDVPRRVGLTATHMQMGIDACKRGQHLAVLPQAIAAANGFCELSIRGVKLPAIPHFVTTRRQLPTQPGEFQDLVAGLVRAFASNG